MSNYLGIDTSNYTTSAAVYLSLDKSIVQNKKLLPVKEGEKGIRQSDALFHHTLQLPEVINGLDFDFSEGLSALGVSSRPRDKEGSYMPCFLAGKSTALSVSKVNNIPLHIFSHQAGHIAAALYSAGRTDLFEKSFAAFHISGGTTEALYITPHSEYVFNAQIISKTLDISCGQLIDRVGVMLNMKFPCGEELEKTALKSDKSFSPKPTFKGKDCCLSGIENRCRDMFSQGNSREDISRYCIEYVSGVISAMTENIIKEYGDIPIIYSGGVMSDSIIRNNISGKYGGFFAKPEFSCDNACGIALLTAYKENEL